MTTNSDNKLQKYWTLSLKNTFSNFRYSAYLEFKPFPLPLPSPPFNVDCLRSQHLFVLLATLIRGEGGCSVRDNREINNAPRRWSVSTIFATCCSKGHYAPDWKVYFGALIDIKKCKGCAYWLENREPPFWFNVMKQMDANYWTISLLGNPEERSSNMWLK